MYKLVPPKPIEIDLSTVEGFELRKQSAAWLASNTNTTGAERGNKNEQGYGALAEIVVRKYLGLDIIKADDHPIGYDILLPKGVKVDVKCRGGKMPFKEAYESVDGIPREAKHNFFARQLHDNKLDTDIYLLTHLTVAGEGELPGTARQRKWKLYVCGWVSKQRVIHDGVYLPRQSLTEQGNTWFTYRGQEVEFYQKNLKGLSSIKDLLALDEKDVQADSIITGDLNMTSVDALRVASDLVGRGVLSRQHVEALKKKFGITKEVKPILHPNQYFHLLGWMAKEGIISREQLELLEQIMKPEDFSGI